MGASKRLYEEAMDKIPARPTTVESTTWKRAGHNTAGPCTEAVCDLFDATCLADLAENSFVQGETPTERTVYYLGYREDWDAGLCGGFLTDVFNTKEEVESFCNRNWEKFHLLADSIEAGDVVDPYDHIITWR